MITYAPIRRPAQPDRIVRTWSCCPPALKYPPKPGRWPKCSASNSIPTDMPTRRPLPPVATSKPGIFVCGLFQSPKDIPGNHGPGQCRGLQRFPCLEFPAGGRTAGGNVSPRSATSVRNPRASACSSATAATTSAAWWTWMRWPVLPRAFRMWRAAENIGHGCSRTAIQRLVEAIQKYKLNRVVMGACSPRTHETKFQDALRRAGLNKYLLEIAQSPGPGHLGAQRPSGQGLPKKPGN